MPNDFEKNYKRILSGKTIEYHKETEEISPSENSLLQAIAKMNNETRNKEVE